MLTPTLTLPACADITPGSPADNTDTITRLAAIVLQLISSVLLSHRRIMRALRGYAQRLGEANLQGRLLFGSRRTTRFSIVGRAPRPRLATPDSSVPRRWS